MDNDSDVANLISILLSRSINYLETPGIAISQQNHICEQRKENLTTNNVRAPVLKLNQEAD
jgi:hypothetical protein